MNIIHPVYKNQIDLISDVWQDSVFLHENVASAIKHQYANGSLDDILSLGQGSRQQVYYVGQTSLDKNSEISLALKLRRNKPFNSESKLLTEQICGINGNYDLQNYPLSFLAILRWDENNFGILTQDISDGKTIPVKVEQEPSEYAKRFVGDKIERIFIDPLFLREKYCTDPKSIMKEFMNLTLVLDKKYIQGPGNY